MDQSILRVTDGQVNGRSNDMNTILTVQLEDLDDNPPEFEFVEKAWDPQIDEICDFTPDRRVFGSLIRLSLLKNANLEYFTKVE